MNRQPTIEANGGGQDVQTRINWLTAIFDETCHNVAKSDEPTHEVCYWPGSIIKMDDGDGVLTIYWFDAISMGCFRWAFDAAWNKLGNDTEVVHRALDEMNDAELEPFEIVQ